MSNHIKGTTVAEMEQLIREIDENYKQRRRWLIDAGIPEDEVDEYMFIEFAHAMWKPYDIGDSNE